MNTIEIKGMTCNHCSQSVSNAISSIHGVASVEVDLGKGTATWKDKDTSSPASIDAVKKAVNSIGFEVK